MLTNIQKEEVFCFWCNKWIDAHLVLIDVLYEGSITCDKEHLIGNKQDLEWQTMFGVEESD